MTWTNVFLAVVCIGTMFSFIIPIYNQKVKARSHPPLPHVHFCFGTNSSFTLLLLMSLEFYWHFETSVPNSEFW